MLITLNNGRTVEIPFEQFDSMNDTEWKYFLDSEYGEEINDPFFHSQVDYKKETDDLSDDDIIEFED